MPVGLVVEVPLWPGAGALPAVCAIAHAPHVRVTANSIILIFICKPPIRKSISRSVQIQIFLDS